jgi:hypothetical protein
MRPSIRGTILVRCIKIKSVPDRREKGKSYSIERQQWPFVYTWGCNGAFHPSVVTKVTCGEAMGYCDSKTNRMQNFSP